jgi:hypothetical protein
MDPEKGGEMRQSDANPATLASAAGARIAAKIVIALAALFGVAVELLRAKTLSGVLNQLSYYTIQSNLIVAGVCLASLLSRGAEENPLMAATRGGSTIWITVTFLVYHFLLSKSYHPQGIYSFSNIALHYFTAIAMILEWLFLEPKGRMKIRFSLYWLGYPLLYVLFSELRGGLGGPYPYWFLNPSLPYPKGVGSIWGVIAIVSGLLAFFGLLGLGLSALDKAMGKRDSP